MGYLCKLFILVMVAERTIQKNYVKPYYDTRQQDYTFPQQSDYNDYQRQPYEPVTNAIPLPPIFQDVTANAAYSQAQKPYIQFNDGILKISGQRGSCEVPPCFWFRDGKFKVNRHSPNEIIINGARLPNYFLFQECNNPRSIPPPCPINFPDNTWLPPDTAYNHAPPRPMFKYYSLQFCTLLTLALISYVKFNF